MTPRKGGPIERRVVLLGRVSGNSGRARLAIESVLEASRHPEWVTLARARGDLNSTMDDEEGVLAVAEWRLAALMGIEIPDGLARGQD